MSFIKWSFISMVGNKGLDNIVVVAQKSQSLLSMVCNIFLVFMTVVMITSQSLLSMVCNKREHFAELRVLASQSLLSMVCNNEVMRFSVLHLQLSYQNISKMLSFSYENWLFSYLWNYCGDLHKLLQTNYHDTRIKSE